MSRYIQTDTIFELGRIGLDRQVELGGNFGNGWQVGMAMGAGARGGLTGRGGIFSPRPATRKTKKNVYI